MGFEMAEEERKPRSIDDLASVPYSEMTDEEIGSVIEWKASIKARDEVHEKAMQALRETQAQIVADNAKVAEQAVKDLQSLQDSALDRLARASRGEDV